MKRIFVADGHPAVRLGIRELAEANDDLIVVGESGDVYEVVRLVRETRPDLVILGLNLEGGRTGIEACEELKSLPEPPRVLVYAALDFADRIVACLLHGVDGYVHRKARCGELLDAIRCAAAGERVWISRDSSNGTRYWTREASDGAVLTGKERGVLIFLLDSCSNPEIAEELCVSVATVRTHVRSVLRKLDVGCRRDLFRSRPGEGFKF